MATCKDCIHFNDCLSSAKTRYYGEKSACNDVQERCKYFKDKSGFIELPCKLKDEITLLDGEKRTVEYLIYDGEWHFGTENGEFNEREIINPSSDRKGAKESSPKESAHNSFFYNRFVKTV